MLQDKDFQAAVVLDLMLTEKTVTKVAVEVAPVAEEQVHLTVVKTIVAVSVEIK